MPVLVRKMIVERTDGSNTMVVIESMAKKIHIYYCAFQREQRSFAENLMVMNGLYFRRLRIHMILLML